MFAILLASLDTTSECKKHILQILDLFWTAIY